MIQSCIKAFHKKNTLAISKKDFAIFNKKMAVFTIKPVSIAGHDCAGFHIKNKQGVP
jgi:hypothetical protein